MVPHGVARRERPLRRAARSHRLHPRVPLVVPEVNTETRKILGRVRGDAVDAHPVRVSAHTTRVPVMGGFIAATPDGATTTLGRGGSDCSAALIGAALGARSVRAAAP